ncbi:hypothetical protein BDZ94DRAFT_1310466 [Collybia nuda]|uniref:HNH nuclease domain-containing protein n=1 Tax=Collybia nuda TaxID=64659 RepID=A0A9P5Y5C3_9AGAR|nr:hypothetical protein BDZ94DRAFT_1310466 [Collybia nuda]
MNYLRVKKAPWNKEQYVNEIERNVHIWCFQTNLVGAMNMGLVGGCYTHNTLKANMIYDWLKIIIDEPTLQVDSMVLVPGCDPRNISSTDLENMLVLYGYESKGIKKNDTLITPGHYFLYVPNPKRITRQNKSELLPHWPQCFKLPKHRKISPGEEKDDSRSEDTKRKTILRDQRVGYHVAHIVALFSVTQPEFMDVIPSTSPIKALLSSRELADRPYNTILMRADIHAAYDDHQFTIVYETKTDSYHVVRFEKNGAYKLEGITTIMLSLDNGVQVIREKIEEVNPGFFLEQTRLCVLFRFMGEGKVDLAHTSLRIQPVKQLNEC